MWERKSPYSWSYLQIWPRIPLIKNLFCLLISVVIYERNTDGIGWIPCGEISRSCTSLVSQLKVDHRKNQNCSLSQECGILQGYSQNNVHLPFWCPYWTSEINISGFQDFVHKHKLHFTFCKNTEKKLILRNHKEKPRVHDTRRENIASPHEYWSWQCNAVSLILLKYLKLLLHQYYYLAGEDRDRRESSCNGSERQTVRRIVMDKGRSFKIGIIWSILCLIS